MWYRALFYIVAIAMAIAGLARLRSWRARQFLLLVLSYALYLSWSRWFGIVLVGSTLINYQVGRRLRRDRSPAMLWTGIALNAGLLSTFKYIPEIAHSFSGGWFHNFSSIALPLGISFWTFQAMSYLFDLYGGEPLDPSLLEFALYMAFFPVTISGPICRMPEMLPQFRSDRGPSRSDVRGGLCRIATGILMMQLAQLLGRGIVAGAGINAGFDHMSGWGGVDVWCLAAGYGLQLFMDFAGYSHIAIGVARVLGFTVPENFNRPFVSTTPSIFWTRWHMSLSFWIRDYVYIPLALQRAEEWWSEFALLISLILFGLWHKGTLLLLLFGCYHGVLLIGHRRVQAVRRRFKFLKRKAPMGPEFSWIISIALIALGWILFRADSVAQAFQMFQAVLAPASYAERFLPSSLFLLVGSLIAGYAVVLVLSDALDKYASGQAISRSEVITVLAKDRWVWIAPVYFFASLATFLLIHHLPQNGPGPFMYAGY